MIRQDVLTQQIIDIFRAQASPNNLRSLSCYEITQKIRKNNWQNYSFDETTQATYMALNELQQSGILHRVNERWRLTKMGFKVKTDETKSPILFTLLTYQRKPNGKKFISGKDISFQCWVFAPLGDGTIKWGALQNQSEIEAFRTTWQSDRKALMNSSLLPNRTKQVMLADLVGVRVGFSSGIGSPFGKKLIGGELYTKATKEESWGKCGTIIERQTIPHLPFKKEKPAKQHFGQSTITTRVSEIEPDSLAQPVVATPLNWEVLPPGWWNDPTKFAGELGILRHALTHYEIERLKFIDSLLPEKLFVGKNYLGRRSYYVAVFPGCVIAESADVFCK